MAIIGTAGHIDHGKSALVHALTAIDPDRLPEEKRRGMTIDLGFAWLPLPSGETVGFVDVPGHEDLVRNMIAGATGIDAAMLVIAADDGWMPQTEEHLRILDLLGVRHGIVALTKTDLVDDPEWLDLVEADIGGRLKGTALEGAPVVRVSAHKGTNIEGLRQQIQQLVSKLGRKDIGKPRLPIDRVFTIKGSGLVLTGTLMDGTLVQGEEAYLFPGGISCRIRGLESYRTKKEKVHAGNRVAINLVGLEKKDLKRGDMVFGGKEQFKSTKVLDAEIRLIPHLAVPLKSTALCAVYLGTREIPGKVVLLGREALKADESSFAQLRFEDEVAAHIGDRFILRRASPPETIGGGIVLDPLAARHKFKDIPKVLPILERRRGLDLEELILSELDKKNCVEERHLLVASQFSRQEIRGCVESLRTKGKLIAGNSWVIGVAFWQRQTALLMELLAKDHELRPEERGLSQAEVQSRLGLPKAPFGHLLVTLSQAGKIFRNGEMIALSGHRPSLSPGQEALVSKILKFFETHRANPPTRKEAVGQMGGDTIFRYMCRQNLLVELPEGIVFDRSHYESVKNRIVGLLRKNNSVTIQEMRDLLGLSRKYIFPLLTKLEEEGVVLHQGDRTVLRG